MREEGYYWVKLAGDDWGIAYWNAELGVWVYGLSVYSVDDFEEVDEKQIVKA